MSWLTRAWDRIRVATATTVEVDEDDTEIHYSPDPSGYPLCNARVGNPWARNFEAVTCARCKELGLPLVIQHDCNTR